MKVLIYQACCSYATWLLEVSRTDQQIRNKAKDLAGIERVLGNEAFHPVNNTKEFLNMLLKSLKR